MSKTVRIRSKIGGAMYVPKENLDAWIAAGWSKEPEKSQGNLDKTKLPKKPDAAGRTVIPKEPQAGARPGKVK